MNEENWFQEKIVSDNWDNHIDNEAISNLLLIIFNKNN